MGNKYINKCHCGNLGSEEYQKIIGGKKIWAHLRFCSEEHKDLYEKHGDTYFALSPRYLKNELAISSLENIVQEKPKYKKPDSSN